MTRLLQDIRFAARLLLRRPGFTVIAVLSLALGIGANTAIFSVIDAVLLRPLPYAQPDRLVRLYETAPQLPLSSVAPANFRDWKEENDVFSQLAAFTLTDLNLQDVASPEHIEAVKATANLFSMLGVRPLLGRTFASGEDQSNASHVVVISEGLWHRHFGSNPQLVGRVISLGGDPYTVVGIMPSRFRFPADAATDVWIPLQIDPQLAAQRDTRSLHVVGRLAPNVELSAATSQMHQIADRLALQYPKEQYGHSVVAVPLRQDITGDIRPALLLLLGAAGLVLLIACANVANLSLARATDRHREVAIRLAVGARRSRLMRQFLTESVLLAVLGAAVGLVLAYVGTPWLVKLSASAVPFARDAGLNPQVLLFLLFIAVLTGLIFGLVPAFHATRVDLQSDLKEGSVQGTTGTGSRRFRNLLVIAETALALVLLVGAGLLMQAFVRLENTNSGMTTRNVLTMHVPVPRQQYHTAVSIRFFQPVLQRINAIPGVRYVGLTSALPLQESHNFGFLRIEGRPAANPGDVPIAEQRVVSPGYFRALGIPIVQGRDFTDHDRGTVGSGAQPAGSAPAVVLINEALAHTYFASRDPIGQRIKVADSVWAPIVGVVSDVRESGLETPSAPTMYFSYLQFPLNEMTLVLSTSVPPTSIIGAVQEAIHSVDPNQPVYKIETMDQVVADSIGDRRLYLALLGTFAGVAFTLAIAGIYGVMSYTVTQRTREIGIRMALGAQASSVRQLVVREGMLLVTTGITCGAVLSLLLTRLLSNLLYGVSSTDPITFASVAALLGVVALVASYIPARRAAAVEPTINLRYE